VPKRLRIRYEPGYRTRFIGKTKAGVQFMAFVVATLPGDRKVDLPGKRWYAVLHTFNRQGDHLNTEAWYAGNTEDGEPAVLERAQARRTEMLAELEPYTLCDVRIKPFGVEIDGAFFGLEVTSDDERGESMTLWPNDFYFRPPWNGTYST
jgi:formate hydrogenlyase regulatory protein HycA